MKIESHHSVEQKRSWKVVRTDSYEDVEGEIVTADEDTGEAKVTVPKPDGSGTEEKTLTFGAGGIRIVGRGRR